MFNVPNCTLVIGTEPYISITYTQGTHSSKQMCYKGHHIAIHHKKRSFRPHQLPASALACLGICRISFLTSQAKYVDMRLLNIKFVDKHMPKLFDRKDYLFDMCSYIVCQCLHVLFLVLSVNFICSNVILSLPLLGQLC